LGVRDFEGVDSFDLTACPTRRTSVSFATMREGNRGVFRGGVRVWSRRGPDSARLFELLVVELEVDILNEMCS